MILINKKMIMNIIIIKLSKQIDKHLKIINIKKECSKGKNYIKKR